MPIILFILFFFWIITWIFGIFQKSTYIIKLAKKLLYGVLALVLWYTIFLWFYNSSNDEKIEENISIAMELIELENQVKRINPDYIIELTYMKENRWMSEELYVNALKAITNRNITMSWTWQTLDSIELYYMWWHYVEDRKNITNLTKNTSYSWTAYYVDNVDIKKELERLWENKQMSSWDYQNYKNNGVYFEWRNLDEQMYWVYGDSGIWRKTIQDEIPKWSWTLIWK